MPNQLTSSQIIFDLNILPEIRDSNTYMSSLGTNLYQPRVGDLLVECKRQANNDVIRSILQYTNRSKLKYFVELRERALWYYNKHKNSIDHNMYSNFGMIIPESIYGIYQSQEANLTKLHINYIRNRLAREGYTSMVRELNYDEVEEIYGKIYLKLSDYIRHAVATYLPLPRSKYDPQMKSHLVKGELTYFPITHSSPVLELQDGLRTLSRDISLQAALHNPRMKPLNQSLRKLARKIVLGYMTSLYAGLRRGVITSELPFEGDIVTKEALHELQKDFLKEVKRLPKYSDGLTTVTKILDAEFTSEGINWEWEIKNAMREWERDPSTMSQEELDTMSVEEIQKRVLLHEATPSEKINSNYPDQLGKERGKRARSLGNTLHRLLPGLLELPIYAKIKDMLDHPSDYDLLGNGWLIATEVKVYDNNDYAEIDLLILKLCEVEYGDGIVEIPYVFLVGEIKTEMYEKYTPVAELRPNRTEKVSQERLDQLLENPSGDKVALKLLTKQFPLPEGLKDKILHVGLEGNDRYSRQIELYTQMVIDVVNEYKLEKFENIPEEILLQEDALQALIKVDSYYQTSKDIEDLAEQQWQLLTSFLARFEDDFNHFTAFSGNKRYSITHEDTPDVGMVISHRKLPKYLGSPGAELKTTWIDPFDQSVHGGKKPPVDGAGEWRTRPIPLKVHLHYPVKGKHHSNELVSEISSLHYLLEEKIDPDRERILLLDVANEFSEFYRERIQGLDIYNKYLGRILDTIDKISIDLSESPIIDLPSEYDIIIVYGLQTLAKESDQKRLQGFRSRILTALQDLCSEIYLIEKPVHDLHMVSSHLIRAVLPFDEYDYLLEGLHITYLASITFNFPREIHTTLMPYPVRDEPRHLITFTPGKYYPDVEFETYSCPRFTGHSLQFDNFETTSHLLHNPKEIDQRELEDLERFFPWYQGFSSHNLSYKIGELDVNIKSIKCNNDCKAKWDHNRIKWGYGRFIYDPMLDLSHRLKYSVPLLPGKFREFGAKSPRKPKISTKQYSTQTPWMTIFDQYSKENRSLIKNLDRLRNMQSTGLKYLRKVLDYLFHNFTTDEEGINDSQSFELVCRYRPELDTKRKEKLAVKLAMMLEELAVIHQGDWIDFDGDMQHTLLILVRNTIKSFGSIQTQQYIDSLCKKLPEDIYEYFRINLHHGHGHQKQLLLLGSWLLVLFAVMLELLPDLEQSYIFSLLYRHIPWIGVQLGFATDDRKRLAQFTYRMYPERVLDSIFNQMQEAQQWLEETKWEQVNLVQEIVPVNLCLHDRSRVMTIEQQLGDFEYFYLKKAGELRSGQTIKYSREYPEKYNLHEPHLDVQYYLVRRNDRKYLYKQEGDMLVSIAHIHFYENGTGDIGNNAIFLNYTNAPPIPRDLYQINELDHAKLDLPTYVPRIRPVLLFTVNTETEELELLIVHEGELLDKQRYFYVRDMLDQIVDLNEELHPIKVDGVEYVIWYNLNQVRPYVDDEKLTNPKRMDTILDSIKEFLFEYSYAKVPSRVQGFPESVADIMELYERRSVERKVKIIIGFDTDRAARSGSAKIEPRTGDDQVFEHEDTYFVTIDDDDFCRTVGPALDLNLTSTGRNYLKPWDIKRLAEKPYFYVDSPDEWVRWNITVYFDVSNLDDKIKFLEHEHIGEIWKQNHAFDLSVLVVPGSHGAKQRYVVEDYDISSDSSYELNLKLEGANDYLPCSHSDETPCDFAENMKYALKTGEVPMNGVQVEQLIRSKGKFDEFLVELEKMVDEHIENCNNNHENDILFS